MDQNPHLLLDKLAQAIYDKKGFNILVLDVAALTQMTSYFVLAEGNIDRHVVAISRAIYDAMLEMGHKPLRVEGDKLGDWVVMDYGDVIVHLFMPDVRERYALEELWRGGAIVNVKIDCDEDVAHRKENS